MKNSKIVSALLVLLLILPTLSITSANEGLGATSPGTSPLDDEAALLGAKLCVNEATWNTVDCAAIMHIRLRSARATGVSLRDRLLELHGGASLRPDRALNPAPNDGRPWIGDLNLEGREPSHWNYRNTMSWEEGQRRFSQILDTVRGVMSGRIKDPCRRGSIVPNTWGDRGRDRDRALRNGYTPAFCGVTSNLYWRQ